MPKRILLLTFFYPPDLSAGSFRAQALVAALRAHAGEAVEIDVFTTQPNRYQEHASETLSFESEDGVRIRRIRLPLHRGGLRGQAVSFVAFGYQAARHLRSERYDLVIATSSRLMTAVLGAWIAYRQRARLYLDVRDIFVENLGDLFPVPVAKPFIRTFDALERWVIRRADKVNLISPGFLGYFQPRYPGRCYSLHSNGVDEAFSCFPEHELHRNKSSRPLQVLYAGNVGDGQALHLIIPKIAGRLGSSIHFRVIGGGGRLKALRLAVSVAGLDNVELIEPVPRLKLLEFYHQADVLFAHLNDFKAFRRVLPSKLFEYAATGKPVWAGVAGYAAEFVKGEIPNSAVFAPCDADAAVEALGKLSLRHQPRAEFVERYSRARIMDGMAGDVLELIEDDRQCVS